jgi:putative transposase
LSKAFDNFFNRIELRKKGFKIKAGFPRFKRRVMSMTYPQKGYKIKNNNKLYISKIGTMPIILSRKIQGKIKTLTIKQNKASQWFAVFSCEIDKPKIKHPNQNIIGIDVGLKKFLTDQKGDTIVNPRFYIHAEKKLSMLQRIHSKRVKGSKNREKARIKVARQHLKVVNQRSDFLHKLTTNLTKNFGIICGERLNIKNMLRGYFAKYILDVSWGKFYQMLSYKAVICGGKLRKNKKLWSSCVCSRCGTWVNMPLSKRIFECSNPDCNLVLSRDQNSANNHIEDAEIGMDSAESTPVEMQPLPLCFAKISCVVESGTIFSTRRM